MSTAAAPTGAASGPRRGGYRGRGTRNHNGGSNSVADPSKAQADDTEQVRALRKKYATELGFLRSIFESWTDEDLLFVLEEAGGDIENATMRISEGHAERFSSVSSKKQPKKDNTSAAPAPALTSATQPASTGPLANGSATRASRGGFAARGGRGTGAPARGGRGGARGGFRGGASGGRGGGIVPQANGHVDTLVAEPPSQTQSTSTGPTWAQAIAKANGVNQKLPEASDWDSPAPSAAAATKAPAVVETVAVEDAKPAAVAASSGWDDEPAPSIAKVAVPQSSSKPAIRSWAQIARPKSPPKPQPPAAAPIPEAVAPVVAVTAAEPQVAEPVVDETTTTTTVVTEDTPAGVVETVITEAPEPSVAVETVEATADEPESAAAPLIEQTVTVEETVPEPVAEAVAAAVPAPSKPAAPRSGLSQRQLARSKQDQAVVMAGGNSLDKLGMQFGTLNFLGGDDNDVPEPTAPAQAAEAPAVAPAVPSEPALAAPEAARKQNVYEESAPELQAQQQQQQQAPAPEASQPQVSAYEQQQPQQNDYGFRSDAFGQGYGNYGQQAQQQHQQQHQHHEQSPYGAFSHGASQQQSQGQQSQPQQAQTPSQTNQGLQDYSMYGGLDTNRLASFYGNYDQNAGFGSRADDRQSQQPQQQDSQTQQHGQHQQQHSQSGAAGSQQQPSSQQAQHQAAQHQQPFPAAAAAMPYYYPHHYYMPNQFQHYGQPGGYGQYALYGGHGGHAQPQHLSKPGTPASLTSPYGSQASHEASGYGSQGYGHSAGGVGGYGQSYGQQGGQDAFGASRNPNAGVQSDYAKIYGSGASSMQGGLGGFLGGGGSGGPPPPGSNGQGTPQQSHQSASSAGVNAGGASAQPKAGGAPSGPGSLPYGRSGYDSKPLGGAGGAAAAGTAPRGAPQYPGAGGAAGGAPGGYYQQYSGYGGQQPNNSSYAANYPYGARGYWGQ